VIDSVYVRIAIPACCAPSLRGGIVVTGKYQYKQKGTSTNAWKQNHGI
jgi:hypothetical protein